MWNRSRIDELSASSAGLASDLATAHSTNEELQRDLDTVIARAQVEALWLQDNTDYSLIRCLSYSLIRCLCVDRELNRTAVKCSAELQTCLKLKPICFSRRLSSRVPMRLSSLSGIEQHELVRCGSKSSESLT